MTLRRLLLLSLLLLPLNACCMTAPRDLTTPTLSAQPWTQTELFFGLSKKDGSVITDADWQSFANDLATAFPNGLTILHADGLYLETRDTPPAPHREPSRVVLLCYPQSDPTANARITSLCNRYMQRFDQLNILRVDTPMRATLLTPP